jgi:hypothetical protein
MPDYEDKKPEEQAVNIPPSEKVVSLDSFRKGK